LPDGIFSYQKSKFLGKFWGVWQWKDLVYFIAIWFILLQYVHFVAIWYILWPFGTFCGHLAHMWPFGTYVAIWHICVHLAHMWPFGTFFTNFGKLHQEKSGNPAYVLVYVCS
jgi:hypothetical protein